MQQRQKMRPTYRPKHERRIKNSRGTRPRSNYTNSTRGKQPHRREGLKNPRPAYLDQPPKRFYMPPDDHSRRDAKMFAQVAALVLGSLAVLYAVTWVYGHFRWGW